MKNHLFSISFSFLFIAFSYTEKAPRHTTNNRVSNRVHEEKSSSLYDQLRLDSCGLSRKAFQYAYKGYLCLLQKKKLTKPSILTICDLSQASDKKRLYILDLCENKVLLTTYVAHGRGSGNSYATRFSNKSRSHQTSLGFYMTGTSYNGEHGISLRLTGLEAGFNSLAAKRHIVIHGAPYVGDEYLQTNKCLGRSYGCPAVPQEECAEIIDLIKDGSCLFVYHPTKKYLSNSRILND